MTLFIQQVVNGLILGGSYTLIALGLTMIYGILYIANFAHGPIYMFGAFVSYFQLTRYGFGFFPSMLISMVVIAALGVLIERLAFRPLRTAPHANGFIAALGLFFILMVEEIFKTITRINQEGTTILLVEQNVRMALQVSNEGFVLETGRIVFADESQALLNNPKIKEAYLGG